MHYSDPASKPMQLRWLLLSIFALSFLPLNAQEGTYASVNDALRAPLGGNGGPSNVQWLDGGKKYSYYRSNPDTRARDIHTYEPSSDTDIRVFEGGRLTFPDSDEIFNYRSFSWTEDGKNLVFQTNFRPIYRYSGTSDYYRYNVESESLSLIAKDANTAEVSPNGRYVGMEREGDMYVYNLDTNEETRLTSDAQESVYNGRYGWAYEEEFGLVQAWKWSHDSRYIAYWQIDESQVPIFQMTDYEGRHPEWETLPYPKVGDKNPMAKIGVVDVQSGDQKWMNLDLREGYVPRIYWTSKEGQLAVVWMNRAQTEMELWFFDVNSGEGQLIMEERADAWIDVFDFFAGILDYFVFPKESDTFFWISDRDGFNHIYRYNYSGELLNQVTDGDWEVTIVNAIDPKGKTIYYTSTEAHPTERQLYRIQANGKKKTRMTPEAGRHEANVSPAGDYFIDSWSNVNTPLQAELWSTKGKGKRVKVYESNEGVKEYMAEHFYSPKELFRFTTSDGQELDGWVIRPKDFDPNKSYPLYLSIYGGPGAQSVYNDFHRSGFEQYLAQEGFIVASVNNRGSGGYGRDFKKTVYKRLGEQEAIDFVETARYMAREMSVDSTRMAIRGHSYGGFMTATTMATHPEVFKAGLCGAPLTDWRLYDSIYAERYMGLLEDNLEGYEARSVMNHVQKMTGKMLLAHSARDENVHMQNSMQLMTAAARAGVDIDLRIYPPGNHSVAFDWNSYSLLYNTYYNYLLENL